MPPLCEKIQRISGYLVAVPLNTTCAMVRLVSVAYSIDPGGMPGTSPRQQSGVDADAVVADSHHGIVAIASDR